VAWDTALLGRTDLFQGARTEGEQLTHGPGEAGRAVAQIDDLIAEHEAGTDRPTGSRKADEAHGLLA
jgi:hypothetical protein